MRSTRLTSPALALLLVLSAVAPLAAQRAERAGVGAFAIEALGGTGGSLAGVGVGLLVAGVGSDRCDVEDLACILEQLAITGTFSVVGASVGTYLAGRAADTAPSGIGAFLGAVAGAAAGAGVVHLLTEEINVSSSNATIAVAYSLTQGLVTALGSRIVAALR